MKAILVLIATVSLSYSIAFGQSIEKFNLTVNVSELKNSTGVVQFSLYNKDGAIPGFDYEKYYKQLKTTIASGSATITFKNLPKGTYAVNILHDENDNGIIEKGWLLPEEGIGFSKLESINLMNRPTYNNTKFELNSNQTIAVKIIYM